MMVYALLMCVGLRVSAPPIFFVLCWIGMVFKFVQYGLKMYQLGKKTDDAS